MLSDIALIATDPLVWYADSVATSHITNNRTLLSDFVATPNAGITGTGKLAAPGHGTLNLMFDVNGKSIPCTLKDVLYIPHMPENLISLTRLDDVGYGQSSKNGVMKIMTPASATITIMDKINRLFRLCIKSTGPEPKAQAFAACAKPRTLMEWHVALGHTPIQQILEMVRKGSVTGLKIAGSTDPVAQCAACVQAKHLVVPFPQDSHMTADAPGHLIVMDIWGPAPTESIGCELYFLSLTNVFS